MKDNVIITYSPPGKTITYRTDTLATRTGERLPYYIILGEVAREAEVAG